MFTTRSIRTSYNTLCTKIIRLNLYDSQSPDPNIVFRERLSTRVFLLLLISAVFILTLSTSLSVQVKSKTVTQPTQATYERLLKKYSATLQCPCARIAIPYGTFVNVVPIFHQVCSSHFVSQAWIDFVFATNTTFLWPMDIRTSLSAMWQLISALCQNAKNSLNDAMNQFNNSTLINTMVLSEQVLQAQSAAALDISCRAASSALVRPFIAIEKITQANGFSTGLLLNAIAIIPTTKLKSEADPLWSSVTTYILQGTTNSCFCQINGSCPIPGGLYLYEAWETYGTYNLSRITANITLPGFVFDCLPIMMTLSSSLECFYNESCLKILLSAYSSTINVSVLDNTKPSRFVPTTIVENLINELFVEEILNKTNYTSYYNACAPIYCRYTFSRRFDWIYVVTTMLALVGGLKTILHFITPYAIKLIFFLYRLRRRRSPQVESQANEIIPIRTSLRNSFVRIKQSIIELNFFRARSQNLLYIRQGRIATRLYVVLLTGTISILIVYTSTSMQTVSKTIQSPLQEKYEELQKQYPHTLHCPCSVVAIPYKELIDMVPIYHQLCRSDLVQSWWYQSLYSGLKEAEFHPIHTFPPYFRLMAMLCEVANLTIVAVNHRFSSMMFNNAQVLAEELFDSQMNATIDTLLRSTQAEFVYTMSLINAVLEANQYVSVWKGNTIVMQRNFSKFDSLALSPVKIIAASRTNKVKHGKTCYCVRNAACNLTSLYDEFDSLVIEGVRSISCSVLDSVLQSTLACWYKNDCLNHVRELFSYFDVSISDNVTLLDTMQSYRFPPNTPVRTIVNELMVEQWDRSVSYESFYQKCHPVYCSLTYQKRFHIMYIITTLISVYSCLTIILRLVSKIFVKIVFKCIKSTDLNNEPPTANNEAVSAMTTDDQNRRFDLGRYHIWAKLKDKLSKLNLFKSGSDQIEDVHRELLSTRLYLLFLFISMFITSIYTVLSVETTIEIIHKPSQPEYMNLMAFHSNSLRCPCEHISVKHDEFMTINNSFHQVCSSHFVEDIWIDYLFGDGLWYNYERSDLRVRGSAYFALLSTLCRVSQSTIQNNTEQFLTETFVNAEIIAEFEFVSKMAVITQQFQTTISDRLSRSLRLLRDMTHGNTFISSYFLNWNFWIKTNRNSMTCPTRPVVVDNHCSCGTRSDCVEPGGIYRSFSNIQYFVMPGWNVGCSAAETLLRSTLECFYNQTCINLLIHYTTTVNISYPRAINVSVLKSSLPSRFPMTTRIGDIVDGLFVEQWQINVSYATFYKQCAPTYCSYTIEKHNSFLNIVLTLLRLYGGLSVGLYFIVPYLIKLALKIRDRCFVNRVTPFA